jgi:hypothetical protein
MRSLDAYFMNGMVGSKRINIILEISDGRSGVQGGETPLLPPFGGYGGKSKTRSLHEVCLEPFGKLKINSSMGSG